MLTLSPSNLASILDLCAKATQSWHAQDHQTRAWSHPFLVVDFNTLEVMTYSITPDAHLKDWNKENPHLELISAKWFGKDDTWRIEHEMSNIIKRRKSLDEHIAKRQERRQSRRASDLTCRNTPFANLRTLLG
jgi:phage/plasmid-associated DNA primase